MSNGSAFSSPILPLPFLLFTCPISAAVPKNARSRVHRHQVEEGSSAVKNCQLIHDPIEREYLK